MILRNAISADFTDSSSPDLSKYDILDAKRTILLFVTPEESKMGFTKCKAVVINECVYLSKKNMMFSIKLNGGVVIRNATYFGTLSLDKPGDYRDGRFFIEVAVTKEMQVSNDGNTLRYSPAAYSYKWAIASDDARTWYMDGDCNEITCIPPEYFTDYQMYIEAGDNHALIDDVYESSDIKLRQLVTNYTKFELTDVNYWDTMRLTLNKQMTDVESKNSDSITIPSNIGSSADTYNGVNTIFIYDSDAKGVNSSGINVKSGYVPYGKYIPKQYLVNNLSGTLSMFEMSCKDVESMYGHVRVLFCPTMVGNKYRIKFKDYHEGNSPIESLSKVGQGASGKPSTTIDTGYVQDKAIESVIQDCEGDTAKELAGY